MAGHAVVPQLTVPSAPHRHIRRDSTADVGILSRAAAETEARLLRVHAGIRGTRAAGVPACTCTRRSWVAPLPGEGWAKATRTSWPGPATATARATARATATATATRPKSTASTESATGPV